MNRYRKQIEITDTGVVFGSVYRLSDGTRCGFKSSSPMFDCVSGIENCAKKMHTWADDYIAMCERQEVMP